MGYSHDDWLRDQGRIPGINLDAIRWGHRVEPRKTLAVSFMGELVPGKEKMPEKKVRSEREQRDVGPGYERFQLRLW